MTIYDVELGPVLLGICLNVLLAGMVIMQTFEFYRSSRKDATWVSYFVAAVIFADLANTGFSIASIYYLFVSSFGDLVAVLKPVWFEAAQTATTGLVSCAIQLFFAYRIKRLTGSIWMAGTIALTALAQAAGSMLVAVYFVKTHNTLDTKGSRWHLIAWLGFAAFTDVLIAGTFVIYMRKSRTGFAATDDIISRIIRLTIQTGSLTTVFAIVDLVLFLTVNNNIHLLLNFPLSQLYTVSLMSSLNARNRWANSASTQHSSRGQQPTGGTSSAGIISSANAALSKVKLSKTSGMHESSEIVELDFKNSSEVSVGMADAPKSPAAFQSPTTSSYSPTAAVHPPPVWTSFPPARSSPTPSKSKRVIDPIRTSDLGSKTAPVTRFSPTRSTSSPFGAQGQVHARPPFVSTTTSTYYMEAQTPISESPTSVGSLSSSPTRRDTQIADMSRFDLEAQEAE